MTFSSQYEQREVTISSISKSMASFSPSATSFLKNILILRWDQQNYHTVDYHPGILRLASTIHLLIFLWTSQGFISPSRIFDEFSLKSVYPNMIGENFQIDVLHITGVCILESKTCIYSLLLMSPKQGSYHHTQREGSY